MQSLIKLFCINTIAIFILTSTCYLLCIPPPLLLLLLLGKQLFKQLLFCMCVDKWVCAPLWEWKLYDNVLCVYALSAICICNSASACNPGFYNRIPGFIFYFPLFFISVPAGKKKKEKKNENNDSLGGLMKLTLVLMSFSQTDSGPQCTLIDTAPPRAQYHLPVSILRRLLSPYLPEPFVPAALSRDATAFSSSSLERPLNAFSPLIYSIIGCSPYFF